MNLPLLEAIEVSKRFPVQTATGSGWLHAVDNISFAIERGETIGLVGESGCGKSTLVRLLTRTLDLTDGQVRFFGKDLGLVPARQMPSHPARRAIQMVFQDPHDSLNPRYSAFDTIAEPLRRLAGLKARSEIKHKVAEIASLVGLPAALLSRFPHQLSGGQKARVGIARAAVLRPQLLVLDEPTAALDVSVQVVILQLLAQLKQELDMSFLFVSHDLNVVRLLCDRVLGMYLGRIVESGTAAELFARPQHPYTRALVASIPGAARNISDYLLPGDPRSPIDPEPQACRFLGRCPHAIDRCGNEAPSLQTTASHHRVACHRWAELPSF